MEIVKLVLSVVRGMIVFPLCWFRWILDCMIRWLATGKVISRAQVVTAPGLGFASLGTSDDPLIWVEDIDEAAARAVFLLRRDVERFKEKACG